MQQLMKAVYYNWNILFFHMFLLLKKRLFSVTGHVHTLGKKYTEMLKVTLLKFF